MGRLSVRSFSVLLSQKQVLDIRVISPGAMKEVTVVAVVASQLDNNTRRTLYERAPRTPVCAGKGGFPAGGEKFSGLGCCVGISR